MKNYISAVILFPIIYLLLYLACLLPMAFTPLILNNNALKDVKPINSIQGEANMDDWVDIGH